MMRATTSQNCSSEGKPDRSCNSLTCRYARYAMRMAGHTRCAEVMSRRLSRHIRQGVSVR